jgi:hypothetical protein
MKATLKAAQIRGGNSLFDRKKLYITNILVDKLIN